MHDSTHLVDYVCAMRLPDGSVRIEHDRHVQGLFTRQTWLDLLGAAGFEPRRIDRDQLRDVDPPVLGLQHRVDAERHEP